MIYKKIDKNFIRSIDKTVYDYIKDEVGATDEYYALNYFGTRITYREFFDKIAEIGRSLEYFGVEKGDIVTICMPNTPEAIETFYAINKVGGVADMIHPLSGVCEIREILNKTESKILFLYDAIYEKLKPYIEETFIEWVVLVSVANSMPKHTKLAYDLTKGLRIKKPNSKDSTYIEFNRFLDYGQRLKKENIPKIFGEDLALILHSGGTTGKQKGIMLSNYNFNAIARQGSDNVGHVTPRDKVMTVLPIFHGFGLGVVVHCPLALKVEVILIPEFKAKNFAHIIKKYKPQIIAGVPTLWEAIMNGKEFQNCDLVSLKYVISGGDTLPIEMEKRMNIFLKGHRAQVVVSKGYGMTESVAATVFTLDGTNELGSIGVPMIGNDIRICKEGTTKEADIGEEGEICVLGPTVMKGYYKDEEETRKVLIRHSDGHLWLHTGDAGFYNENGKLFFTRRLKRVIVSSGFNIYPNAIEEVLLLHPKVKRACVIGIPHPYKMRVAKAYIVLEKGIEASAKVRAELRILCKHHLAAYSQPKEMEFVENLPMTIYNKVDYKELEMIERRKYNEKN